MWRGITYVSSAITLIAFIAAVAAWMYRQNALEKVRLIRSAPADRRPDLVNRALEFFDIDTSGLTRDQQYDLAVRQIDARAARSRNAVMTILAICLIAMGTTAFAVWHQSAEKDSIYRVKIITVGPSGVPIDDTRIDSSVGGDKKRIEGGYQIDIPAGTVPQDKVVTFRASKENAFLYGEQTLHLGPESNPTLTIVLKADTSAMVKGIVLDKHERPIVAARVSVIGQLRAIETDSAGQFVLPAHAADGQQVQLRVERVGYEPKTRWVPAGDHPLTIVLEKQ
jgi:hypothetical protein